MKKRENILKCAGLVPVVLLYFSFLAVQLSFNFDVPGNNGQLYNSHATGTALKFHSCKTNDGKTGGINTRLNKRFQPEKAICCNSAFVPATPYHVIGKTLYSYKREFFCAPAFAARLLRGPPVAA